MTDSASPVGVAAHTPAAEHRWPFAPGLVARLTRPDGAELAKARLEVLHGDSVDRSFALADWFTAHQSAQWRAQSPTLKGIRALLVRHKVLAHPELVCGRGVDLGVFDPVPRAALATLRRRWFNAFEVRNLSGPGRRCDRCPDAPHPAPASGDTPEGSWRSARDLDCPHAPLGDDALRALASDAPALVLELIGVLAVDAATGRYGLDAAFARAALDDVEGPEYPVSLRAITPGSEALSPPEVDDTAPVKRTRRPRPPRPPREALPPIVEATPAPTAPTPRRASSKPAAPVAPKPRARPAPAKAAAKAAAKPAVTAKLAAPTAGPRVFSRAELAGLFTADFLSGLLRSKRVVQVGRGRYQFVR